MLSGVVSAKYVIDRAKALAAGYVDKPENIVNMLRQTGEPRHQPGDAEGAVRRSEPQRDAGARRELLRRAERATSGWMGRSTTQQYPAPTFDADKKAWIIADFLNLFAFQRRRDSSA